MALTQISTEGIKNGTITGSDLATNVDLVDNQKLRLGTGNDLELFHQGGYSIIKDTNDNPINIQTDGEIKLAKDGNAETYARFIPDGAVELYHDNVLECFTHASGLEVKTGSTSLDTEFKVVGNEGKDAVIRMLSDDGDDNADMWRLRAAHVGNGFTIESYASGAYQSVLKATDGRAIELHYQDSKKFDTTSYGTRTTGNHTITGQLTLETDGQKAVFGAGEDLQIYHDSNVNFIDSPSHEVRIRGTYVALQPNGGGAQMALGTAGGSFAIFHNGNEKLATASNGVSITGNVLFSDSGGANSGRAVFGAGSDLEIYHDGSHSHINEETGNLLIGVEGEFQVLNRQENEYRIRAHNNGGVDLYYDHSKTFETVSGGNKFYGYLFGTDDAKIYLGASNDLEIYHNGSNSYLTNDTGYLQLQSSYGVLLQRHDGSENLLRALSNGAVELYYDGNKKLETTSTGATVTGSLIATDHVYVGHHDYLYFTSTAGWSPRIGNADGGTGVNMTFHTNNIARIYLQNDGHFRPASNNNYDLGTSSDRWRNIYTNDLNLSNEGGSNDVDGTWGSYTIQEGAEDLFLVNKRNGKKYKFNLTEVS